MSSVLSLFWSSKPTPATTTAAGAADPPVPPSLSSSSTSASASASVEEKEDGDESFVIVDAPMAQTPKDMECSTPSVMVEPVAAVVETPKATAPPASSSSSSRTCRPYGHAHSPPALLAPSPAAVPVTPVVASISTSAVAPLSSSSSTSSSSKRSFASVACSTPPAASSSRIIAYAENASIAIADQLKAKIDQLSAEVAQSVAAAADAEEQQRSESTLRLPLLSRGVSGSGPVERPLDAKFDWALGVEEPKSKRAKRTAASSNAPLLLSKAEQAAKLAKSKGKPHKVARKEDKEMRRAREDKEGSEISAQ